MSALAPALQAFFTDRLMAQRDASPNTISAYKTGLRLLVGFAAERTGKSPSALDIAELDAPVVAAFLDHPEHAGSIQRVLAIPAKRSQRNLVTYLAENEVDALLSSCATSRWTGRRDHAMFALTIQTGLRISELAGLDCDDVTLASGAHVHTLGKGRKERRTPLVPPTRAILKAWLDERAGSLTRPAVSDHDRAPTEPRRHRTSPRSPPGDRRHHVPVDRDQARDHAHTASHRGHAAMRPCGHAASLAAGVHPKVVSERLGHATVAFTLDVYSHAVPALEEEAPTASPRSSSRQHSDHGDAEDAGDEDGIVFDERHLRCHVEMTASAPHPSTPDELQSLVLEAFRRARRTGKPEWYRMAPAVLKNRLLDVTKRRFNEGDFGAQRFGELVPMLDGTVSVDTSVRPPVLELVRQARALLDQDEEGPHESPRARVRSDLWNAVLDYSSAATWRWNPETSIAEPVEAGEFPDGERLPTIRSSDLAEWRHAFVDEHEGELPEELKSVANDWAEHGRRSEMLPRHLRGQWFEYLKRRVIEVLESWFAERGLPVPSDLREEGRAPARRPTDQVELLRDFVISCVRSMSAAELATLQLPASAALRTRR